MIATAHILISVAGVHTKEVLDRLSRVQGVVNVDAVSGPFDIIATVQAADYNMIGRLVVDEIRNIDGITDTVTCNVINFQQ